MYTLKYLTSNDVIVEQESFESYEEAELAFHCSTYHAADLYEEDCDGEEFIESMHRQF